MAAASWRSGRSGGQRDWMTTWMRQARAWQRHGRMHLHAVLLRDGADVVGSGDGTEDGGLLLVVREALAGKVCATTLRYL